MPLADELISAQTAVQFADLAERVTPEVSLASVRAAATSLAGLGLRARTDALADAIRTDVGAYPDLARVVRTWLTAGDSPDDGLSGWIVWPVTEAVSAAALAEGDATDAREATAEAPAFEDALALLAELTGRLTAEFAIRPLLSHDLDRALPVVLSWTEHPDEHVRRLASEGTRRYLPWGTRVPALMDDATVTLPVLDALSTDESEYVRRSVANHLNDLSRTDPGVTVETARRWLAAPGPGTEQTVRHALRTLVKKGDPDALALLGFAPSPDVVVRGLTLSASQVRVGETVELTADVHNTGSAPARVSIDYVVHHRKANGTQTAKVFKLRTATIPAGASLTVARRHSFKVITTRRYHPGEHAVEIQVNGAPSTRATFELLAADD